MYRGFPFTLCLHTYIASFIINVSHQNSTFVISEEPTLTRHSHLKSIVYVRVHSWRCTFYGFGQMSYVHQYDIVQSFSPS